MFDIIAFDADDTLWHNEILYHNAQGKLRELLSPYAAGEAVERHLYETEMSNIELYGYGIKSFALSMIETAIELTDGKILAEEIQKIIEITRWMLTADVQLIEGVKETVLTLAQSYQLMVITKGDLLDQESKLRRSGIADCFRWVEVVSEKNEPTYQALLDRYRFEPNRFLMVGNSMKSDILPILALGGHAVYIPHHLTWAHENSDHHPHGQNGFYELERIGQLPALLKLLNRTAS
jgi:putative hydrolase of the HAD superfamily